MPRSGNPILSATTTASATRRNATRMAPLYAGWLEELGKKRQELFSQALDPEERRRSLHAAASRQAFDSQHDRIMDATEDRP